jgi:Acetyltransferase (GNAT) family
MAAAVPEGAGARTPDYPPGDVRATWSPQAAPDAVPAAGAPAVDADAEVGIRFLRADEAEQLSLAVLRCYGVSYDVDWVYRPAEISARIDAGTLRSIVGIADEDIVGHLGLTLDSPEAVVGESGQAVVDPRYRGHHLFTTLKRRLADELRAQGLAGMFSEATAAHPYSQKANIALGARETGILVGYIPASVNYSDVAEAAERHRRSVVLYYLKTNEGPAHPVFAPRGHRRMVGAIFERAGLHGELAEAPSGRAPAETELHDTVRDDHGAGYVTVASVGRDLREAAGARLERDFADGLDCVYVDLPLDDPATERHGDELHELGFLFGGVFPNLRRTGDVLRLQALDRAAADAGDVRLASDEARELLAYVLGA